MSLANHISHLRPCRDAVTWLDSQTDPVTAWHTCPRGDWMLWLLGRCGCDRKQLVWAACQCARLALPYTTDPRVVTCIETTERWTRGECSIDDVKRAKADAYAATATYAAYAATYAATAVTYADAYADAAAAAAYAAAAAAYVRTRVQQQTADIVRGIFPLPPEIPCTTR